MGLKVSQVVHLDKVEMVFPLQQIRLLIYPLRPLFRHTSTLLGRGKTEGCLSSPTLHLFSQFSILKICLGTGSFRGPELKKDILLPMECLEILFHVGECLQCMTPILAHQTEINQRTNTFQGAFE
jgi:hypothetical protein